MLTSLTKKIKVDFFTRLSHIIIIQICFIFAAVSLVIFFQQEQEIDREDYLSLKNRFAELGDNLERLLTVQTDGDGFDKRLPEIKSSFGHLFDLNSIAQAYLYIKDSSGTPIKIFTLKQYPDADNPEINQAYLFDLVDEKIVFNEIDRIHENLIQVTPNNKYILYYYHFNLNDKYPVVLTTVIEHEYIVANRPDLIYLFILLFLASLFIALLIVYLIDVRFKGPLKRVMHGLEKTTQGEVYYMVETGDDSELNELSRAFNKMSSTLYANEKQLKQSYRQLESSNIKLKDSQEYLRLIIENSPTSIITTDAQYRVEMFNKNATSEFNWQEKEITGTHINELFTHTLKEYHAQMAAAGSSGVEVLCKRKDHSYFPAYLIETPIKNQRRQVTAYLFIIHDISESKNFKEMMIRLDRYYTRGQMAGDIAHEINNFLTILSGNIELLPVLLEQNNPEKLTSRIELMRTTVERIANFTDGLMDTGETEIRYEKTDANQLIETVLTFLKPQNKFDNIDITTDLSTDIPLVEIDPGQIQQLLVNLIYNAGDALADRQDNAKIAIISRSMHFSDNKEAIQITIHDNGPGIPEEKQQTLFINRFTTKRKGHGIGLITCKNIVDKHHGTIGYSTSNGACFEICLPVAQPVSKKVDCSKTMRINVPVS